ncbi:transporter [Ganoderma sinense ZZ0214-1]|uniref:Transporter n=1 Tax=Ganoderma sinense ZZ0214-1 TaxID=1077348 RepID=A0A2G8SAJ3_9APHY|nr:transporter [Ganoderma sinense ZZ0214-1]
MASTNAPEPIPIETSHEDMIHDAQLDYYGKRLATCSSDRTVKVFDVVDGETQRGGGHTLKGHTGPVWQVAWAHPKFGQILASCSYDGKVIIWKEQQGQGPGAGGWTKIKEHTLHKASVNSISWAPQELGAILACASSDGTISVLTFKNDGTWGAAVFEGHAIGCNAVSWAPAVQPGSLLVPQPNIVPGHAPAAIQSVKRFASAGCDNLVKIWGFRDDTQEWFEEDVLEGHQDWVRDVAWAPNIGLPRSYIATASQDKTVLIWTKDAPTAPWAKMALDPSSMSVPAAPGAAAAAPAGKFPDVVWRVSWSLSGNILAVSCGDGKVTLWKENLKGVWECVSDVTS